MSLEHRIFLKTIICSSVHMLASSINSLNSYFSAMHVSRMFISKAISIRLHIPTFLLTTAYPTFLKTTWQLFCLTLSILHVWTGCHCLSTEVELYQLSYLSNNHISSLAEKKYLLNLLNPTMPLGAVATLFRFYDNFVCLFVSGNQCLCRSTSSLIFFTFFNIFHTCRSLRYFFQRLKCDLTCTIWSAS